MESVGVLTGIGVKVGLAVALALGATAAARYFHMARHGWRPGRGVLRVVETAALGQNRALHLVRVGKRTLFLASTPSRIVMLADVTGEQEEVAREAAEEGGAARGAVRVGRDFASLLRRLLAPEGGVVSALTCPVRKSRNTEEVAGMGMPALQRTAGAGDTLPTASPRRGLPYDSGTTRRPEDRAPTGAVSGLKSRNTEEVAGMDMPALQRTAGAGDTLPTASPRRGLPYDSGTTRRPEDRAPTGAVSGLKSRNTGKSGSAEGDCAERLLAAAEMLRGERARGWVG